MERGVFRTEIQEKREMPRVRGKIEAYNPGVTDRDGNPIDEIRLVGDPKVYTFYAGGWMSIEPGANVELFSESGFEEPHDDGGNYYLDGVKVYDQSGALIGTFRVAHITSLD